MIIGTAGHVDHGKTALVKALTGTDTDRLPEEKRRGITLELGFAQQTQPVGAQPRQQVGRQRRRAAETQAPALSGSTSKRASSVTCS